jgi:hypothetical protein
MCVAEDLLMSTFSEFLKWNVQSFFGNIQMELNNNKISLAFLSNMNWDDIKVN